MTLDLDEYGVQWIQYYFLFSEDNIIRIKYKLKGLDDYITTTIYKKTAQEHNILKNWALQIIGSPEPRIIANREIPRHHEIKRIEKSLIVDLGEDPVFRISYSEKDNFGENGKKIDLLLEDTSAVISTLLFIIEKEVIQKVESHITEKLNIPFKIEDKKHVFIAYRDREEPKNIAREIGIYLIENGIQPWFFPWNMSVGDSMTEQGERALEQAFASIIVYTRDFLEGRTTVKEYRALQALSKEKPDLRICVLRVNCSVDDLPTFLKDSFSLKIISENDPELNEKIEGLTKGVLELPLETPPV